MRASRGQIVVMFALGLFVFLGFAALTVDIGFLLVNHRTYQNSADAASLAGSVYLTRPVNDPCADIAGGATTKHDCARGAAWAYLRDDLRLALTDADISDPGGLKFSNTPAAGRVVSTTDGGADYRIWVSTPPVDAGIASSMSTVRDERQVLFVRVDRFVKPFIAGVLGIGELNVSAWATAGVLPDRWAVMTLRRGKDTTEIDAGPMDTTDFKLSGTGATLEVVNGDVGGNWGMKLAAGSILKVHSTLGDEANVYLIDHVSCGNSCWGSGQVINGLGAPVSPKKLPAYVNDPLYAPPTIDATVWPDGAIDNATLRDIPNGDTAPTAFGGNPPDIRIRQGSVTGAGTCVGPDGTEGTAPRIGPGTYDDIRVDTGNCLILDPRRRFRDPELGLNSPGAPDPTTPTADWSWVGMSQYPGVFYVTGNFDIQTNALIVGDGVTVVIRPPNQFRPSGGGAMDINRDKVIDPAGGQKMGGWTTKAQSPWTWNGTNWDYNISLEGNPTLNGVGLAMIVLKPAQAGITDTDGTDVIKVSSGSALAWSGVTYAPFDNVVIAGQPNHDGIGQLISWTFAFVGNTNVKQTFDGVGDGLPYLIEPCILVSGSCE